ncbi:YceI family protein [Flexibacterium corallicola]|uniref:YceI family protein n=1 Tax=Flexibacterium corallicola TaxID=3037259 RepID=UPI00286EF4E3|nr:YceI family protein [Pseudovibrio sp. M1P-2-3]
MGTTPDLDSLKGILMKPFSIAALALTASLMTSVAQAEPQDFVFDMSHSNIAFSYNHLGYSTTDGRFADWSGTLVIDEEKPENSKVDITISTNSLDTFSQKRDEHLKGADFFNVEKYPEATFRSTKVMKTAENMLEVTGDLTLHGVTKPTTLEVTVNRLAEHPMSKKMVAGLTATTMIKRSEFGIDKYVPYVGDEVTITINSEASLAQ